ncbi:MULTISPECIES: arginyltransferase [Vibrio]|uniref:Aspartate/glutamate leucyltransferase n=1 Tax=Vibrio cortegadensis TaxID=1328770 RepID=A0ABV4M7R6_9VIBR|nr:MULTISPECIES: arginyltransferase [Vibrio]MDN3698085.1 arginyltransferase [Vibrio cortegadensis]NOH84151.1 arginyltransferase [Vibrio sp. 03-59-1]RBW65409.1 arginyltransferase [Vibrionales bacterium C3R12]TKF24093.1 arginyltransferase [Vibrio genomosp. F6]
MSSDLQQIKIGLTDNHPCSYLADRQERVAVALDNEMQTAASYEILLANGFRRSGDTIYRPHCDKCQACTALRVDIPNFKPSKSQKRVLNKANHLRWELKSSMDEQWFELYSRYINARHKHGTMYPPKQKEFFQFSQAKWLNCRFLHIYDQETLVAIAVTDDLNNCASAFYTFFDPDVDLSIGTLAVLYQIQYCQKLNKQWLYLGYQIDDCSAMNYKVRFQPHQRLVNQRWQG